MCFSVQASFGAGAILAVAGIASIKKVTKSPHYLFAALPLLFAVQQVTEGFLWIALTKDGYDNWKSNAMHIFLFFAQVVWPLWVPLSIWLLEENKTRKKILFGLFCAGLFTSACLAYFLLSYPVSARVSNHHIFYELGFSDAALKLSILYFIPTVITSFISSYRGVQWMGLAVLASFITSRLFFREELLSVWCFFASLISGVILFIMNSIKKSRVISGK